MEEKPKCIVFEAWDTFSPLFWNEEDEGIGDTDSFFLGDEEYSVFPIKGLKEWFGKADEYDPHTDVTQFTTKGMEEWINQGYEFATQILEIIPEDIDLYYGFRHQFGDGRWRYCRAYIRKHNPPFNPEQELEPIEIKIHKNNNEKVAVEPLDKRKELLEEVEKSVLLQCRGRNVSKLELRQIILRELEKRQMFQKEKEWKIISRQVNTFLQKFEREYNVKVLLAVESGSRAWGFESKNSDWDIRFIYVYKQEWYLSIEDKNDVIEHTYGDFDFAGWELRKALALFKRSNTSFFEWLHSPGIYFVDEEFIGRIRDIEKDFFNPIGAMYHYNRMYNKHNERYLQKIDCSMKRFLYYLRGILACKWIEKNQSIPPVLFEELVEATVEEKEIKAKIGELIRLKKDGKEHDLKVVDNELMEYARNWADYYNERVDSFRPERNNVSSEALDSIMYDMVLKYSK